MTNQPHHAAPRAAQPPPAPAPAPRLRCGAAGPAAPRQQKSSEVCGCPTRGAPQARRLHIRVKGADGKSYLAHTLNNTCVAPPRMLIAFLENHLQADGSVTIPKVLQPYMGGLEVMVPNHK